MSVLRQWADALRRGITAEAPAPLYPTSRGMGGSTWNTGGTSKAAAMSVVDWNDTIYAIVEAQATAQKRIRWRLYRTASSGRDEDREEVMRHPALSVWARPNRFYTQASLIETLSNHYELTGEKTMLVGRSGVGGVPIELWPVRPDWVAPVRHPTEFATGFTYAPGGSREEAVSLGLEDVIWDLKRHPLDPYRGMSPITAAMLSARADREAQRYNAEFFANDATPGGLVTLPGMLTTPQWEEQVKRWDEQHRGPGKRFRVHFMDNMKDAAFTPMAYTRRDMQFVDLHRVSVEGFMRAYRISDFVLGMLRDVNRAAAEAAMVWFGITHVIPRADDTRDMLNGLFLPIFGPRMSQGYEFDYDDPIPPDRVQAQAEETAALDNALKAIEAGVEPSKAFEQYGLPEDWADDFVKPEPVSEPAGDPSEDMPMEDGEMDGPPSARARFPRAHAARGRRRRARSRVLSMRG